MIVAVVGSRDFNDYELLCKTLNEIEITAIVSGGARGADSLGKRYADEHGIETIIFLPNWDLYGRSAGMIRNTDIIKKSEYVVAFWDGKSRGTKDSINKAKQFDKELKIVFYTM